MKTIIAGSRTVQDYALVTAAIAEAGWHPTLVISGTAPGVDKLGELWARRNNIPIKRFPANWMRYGRAAGYLRNCNMAEHAEALIAVWDGKSRGTSSMIEIATERGLSVYVKVV